MSVTTALFRRLQTIVYVATWDMWNIIVCITLIMKECKLHIPNKMIKSMTNGDMQLYPDAYIGVSFDLIMV